MVANFLDYDRITDTLMYFNQFVTLNFCVNLTRKNKNTGQLTHFHSEYRYENEYLGKESQSIKRFVDGYFMINDSRDYTNSIIITAKDILMLRFVLSDKVFPWFVGKKKVFAFDNTNKLMLRGNWKTVEFPLSEYKYINFKPILLTYEDGTYKEGLRMIINSSDNILDIDINKFFEFYYYMFNVDMYLASITLLNYVKMIPYDCNCIDVSRGNNMNDNSNKKRGFFD